MSKSIFKNLHFGGKLFFLIVAFFVGAIVSSLIFQFGFSGGKDVLNLKISQVVTTLLMFFVPALLCRYLCYEEKNFDYFKERKMSWGIILLALLTMISLLPLVNLLGHLNQAVPLPEIFKTIEKEAAELTIKMLTVRSIWGLLANIVVIVLVPAIAEEYFFRGALLTIFLEKIKNKHLAIWIVAAIFSLLHFQMYGFLPRMLLGGVLSYLLIWSGSIRIPIFAHFINNAMAVVVFYFTGNIDDFESLSTQNVWILGILSLLIAGFLLKTIKEKS